MPQSSLRIPELDGLRGIAVLMVLAYHLFHYSMMGHVWSGLGSFAFSATKNGWEGVDLFFALSGFLITGILLDTRTDPRYFRNFYARRGLRILPLYYLVLLVIWIGYAHSGVFVALGLVYLSNIALMFKIPMLNGAIWSLSVEEHFYLIWPQFVYRLRMRTVAMVASLICLCEPVIRGLASPHVQTVYVYTWFRLDGLACGALMACALRSTKYSVRRATILSACMAAAGILFQIVGAPHGISTHDNRFGAAFQFVPLNLMFSAAVLFAASMTGSIWTRVLRNSFLRVAADLSYCLYLVHCMVMNGYDGVLKQMGRGPAAASFGGVAVRAAVVLGACFAIAALSRRFMELPALSLRKFFLPRPEGAAAVPSAVEAPTATERGPALPA